MIYFEVSRLKVCPHVYKNYWKILFDSYDPKRMLYLFYLFILNYLDFLKLNVTFWITFFCQ